MCGGPWQPAPNELGVASPSPECDPSVKSLLCNETNRVDAVPPTGSVRDMGERLVRTAADSKGPQANGQPHGVSLPPCVPAVPCIRSARGRAYLWPRCKACTLLRPRYNMLRPAAASKSFVGLTCPSRVCASQSSLSDFHGHARKVVVCLASQCAEESVQTSVAWSEHLATVFGTTPSRSIVVLLWMTSGCADRALQPSLTSVSTKFAVASVARAKGLLSLPGLCAAPRKAACGVPISR